MPPPTKHVGLDHCTAGGGLFLGNMANKDTHGSGEEEWVGFDLDGTLAKYDGWKGVEHIGKPVPAMVVLAYLLHKFGRKVKILTARVAPRDGDDGSKARKYVQEWCRDYLWFVPEVTHMKDASMVALFDDRACAVEQNTGKVLGGWPDFLPKPSKKAQKSILDKMPKSEKNAEIELKDGSIDDVRKVIESLSDNEKKLILATGRSEYRDVPKMLAGRTVAYENNIPVGFSDIYGVDNKGRVRSSPRIVTAVSEIARGNRLASKMTRDAIAKVIKRVDERRLEEGKSGDRLRRFVWRLHNGNESSARAAEHAGFKEQEFGKPHSFRQFVLSRQDATKGQKHPTIHDRLVRCVMRRNPGFSEDDAEEYISDGRLDAEIAKRLSTT